MLFIFSIIIIGMFGCTGFFGCASGFESINKDDVIHEPGIIDVHGHIGEFSGFDLSLETLLKNVKENNIEYVFVSNIDGAAIRATKNGDEKDINEETYRVCTQNSNLKPLAWAKPGGSKASADKIEPFLRDKHFYGIKFHPDFNNFSASSNEVIPYLKLCEKYHVPALFHCGSSPRSNAEEIYKAAKKFPTVPFVLYHINFNGDYASSIAVAKQAKEKKDAIIYLETAQATQDAVIRAIKEVGADRVVFGTDATYFGRYHYQYYAPILKAVKAAVPAADFRHYIHDNAVELFHLTEKSPEKTETKSTNGTK